MNNVREESNQFTDKIYLADQVAQALERSAVFSVMIDSFEIHGPGDILIHIFISIVSDLQFRFVLEYGF